MTTAVASVPETRPGATRALVLGTMAFAVSFSAWGLIAPLAKKFQDNLDLSNTRTLMLIAVPVVLGSLLRIPFGIVTDRLRRPARVHGRARRVGGAGCSLRFHRQLLGADRRRLLARHLRRIVRGRDPVRRRLVCKGATGLRPRGLRDREHRHRGRGVHGAGGRQSLGSAHPRRCFRDRGAVVSSAVLTRGAGRAAPGSAAALRGGAALGLAPVPACASSTSSRSAASSRWRSSCRSCSRTGSATRSPTRACGRPASRSPRRSRARSAAGSRTGLAHPRADCDARRSSGRRRRARVDVA